MYSVKSKAKKKATLLLVSAAWLAGCAPAVRAPAVRTPAAVTPAVSTPAVSTLAVSTLAASAPVTTMLPLTGAPSLATATRGVYAAPIYAGDFPDPFVLPVDTVYYAYSTNSNGPNVPMLKISADFSQVEALGDALPVLPGWAAKNRSLTWAPAMLRRGGRYILYYTARYTQIGLQCISRAVSDSPTGPFSDDSTRPLICQISLGGSIDPSPFIDTDGKAYLLWKNDGNSSSKPVSLWIQPLSEDGLAVTGEPRELIQMDQAWEKPLVEAPAMVHQDGRYYLFYSANWWESADYAIGYAVGMAPTGPFVKPMKKPWFSSHDCACGPGGAEFFRDAGGQLWMAYHAWTPPYIGYPKGKRSLRMEPVSFQGGVPVVNGSTHKRTPIP